MSQGITIMLMVFATVGYAGAGIAYAVARAREIEEAEDDIGMRVVAALLAFFAAVCTFIAAGPSGILAFGGVVAWFSYVVTAQHAGVFWLEHGRPAADSPTEHFRLR